MKKILYRLFLTIIIFIGLVLALDIYDVEENEKESPKHK